MDDPRPQRHPLLPPAYLALSLAAMGTLHWLAPGPRLLSFPWTLVGLFPAALALVLAMAALRSFRQAGTTVKPFETASALVTGGVFALSRNPIYLGLVLLLAGIALLLGSLTPWALVPAFALVLDRVFVTAEEARLADRFGQDWHAYRQRVRRWL